jgi:hypothetical protein
VDTLLVLLYILAVLAPTFLLVAWAAHYRFGARGLWITWALTVPFVTGACAYKLSGWASHAPDAAARSVYYAFVALASVGVPLAVGAVVLGRTWRGRRLPAARLAAAEAVLRVIGIAWVATVAMAPLATALVMVVDVTYAAMRG